MGNWIIRQAAALTISAATRSLRTWLKTDSDNVVDVILSIIVYIILLICLYSAKSMGIFTGLVLCPLSAYAIMKLAKTLQKEADETKEEE